MDRLLKAKRALRYIVCLLVAVVAGVAAGKEGAAPEAGVQTAAGTAGTNACCTADNYRAAVLAWACAKTNHSGAQKTRLYTEAINRFSHIEVSHPDSPDAAKALFNQAEICERIRRMAEVLAAYDKLLARYPDSALAPEALARMGQRLLREGKELENNAHNETNSVRKAQFQQEATNQYRFAAQKFSQVVERYSNSELACKAKMLSGQCWMRAKEFDRAIQVYTQALDVSTGSRELQAEAMYWCGDACLRRHTGPKDSVQAYRIWKRLTWDYPETCWSKYACGRLSEPEMALEADRSDNEGEALKPDTETLLSAAVRGQKNGAGVTPDSPGGMRSAPVTEVESLLQKARELRELSLWSKRLHCESTALSDAVAAYRNVVTRDATTEVARVAAWEIAELHERLGDKQQAFKLYQEIVDQLPNSTERGMAYEKIVVDCIDYNDWRKALELIEKYAADPRGVGCDRLLIKGILVACSIGDLAKEKALTEQLVAEHPESELAEQCRNAYSIRAEKISNAAASTDVAARILAKAMDAPMQIPVRAVGPAEDKELLEAAKGYLRNKDNVRAAVWLQRILRSRDSEVTTEARYWMSEIYRESRTFTAAYRSYKKLTWDFPASVWAKYARYRLTTEKAFETNREAMQDEQDSEAALENENVRSTVVFIRPEPFREGKPRAPP